MKYKLNVSRDVDMDEPEVFILNLPAGFRFDDEIVHTRGYDSMAELRVDVKFSVIPCDCTECKRMASIN